MANVSPGTRQTLWSELLHGGRVVLGLLVAAYISGVLVPAVAESWQDHQKELDVKTRLVSDMSSSAAAMMSAIDNFVVNPTTNLTAYNNAYLTWLKESQVESAQLSAYALSSGNDAVVSDWHRLDDSMRDLYVLSICPTPNRHELLAGLRANLSLLLTGTAVQQELAQENAQAVDWQRLEPCYEFLPPGDPYTTDWITMRNQVSIAKDAVIAEIVDAHLLPGPCIWGIFAC